MSVTERLNGLASSAPIKVPCDAATTAAITLSGLQTVDGVVLASGDRVLVKNQADSADNGIYVADTGDWNRAKDFDGNLDVVNGTICTVTGGTTNGSTGWRVECTTDPAVIGTTDITFQEGVFNDAAMIYFLQSGTGAVQRSVQAKERDLVSSMDFGATGDGTADDTAELQAAIDSAIATGRGLLVPSVTHLVEPLDLNGTGHSTPANSEWAGITALEGQGRRVSFFKAGGSYAAGDYVLSCQNTAGKYFGNFGVDGNSVAQKGLYLAWVGGSGGNPAVAPSVQNVVENIFVQGCAGTAISLAQANDCKISGVWVRGTDADDVGFNFEGGGGQMVMDSCWVSAGRFALAAQNYSITGCGLFGGVELTGSSYNHGSWTGCHFYPDATNGNVIIRSTATGNATRGNAFNGCYFNNCDYVLNGRWHEGAVFSGCKFGTWTAFADSANFTPASGGGELPLFTFINCSFESTAPAAVASKWNVKFINCRKSDGTMLDSYQSYGTNQLGNNLTISKTTSLAIGATLDITVARGTYTLSVMSVRADATFRTHTTYHIGLFDTDTFTATSLATNDGSGGSATYTVTNPSNNVIRITNTSGAAVTMTASITGATA